MKHHQSSPVCRTGRLCGKHIKTHQEGADGANWRRRTKVVLFWGFVFFQLQKRVPPKTHHARQVYTYNIGLPGSFNGRPRPTAYDPASAHAVAAAAEAEPEAGAPALCLTQRAHNRRTLAGTVEALLADDAPRPPQPAPQDSLGADVDPAQEGSSSPALFAQEAGEAADGSEGEGALDEQGAPAKGVAPGTPAGALPPGTVRGRRMEPWGSEGDGMDLDAEEVAARGGRLQLEAIDFQRRVRMYC